MLAFKPWPFNTKFSLQCLQNSPIQQILITVAWCKSHSSQGLSICFGDNNHDPSASAPAPPF
ncbi:hypothetical protein Lal_00029870 [Lupinus albus]|nr:hypothetical protein Lal_00029870 [Lupinus albus]